MYGIVGSPIIHVSGLPHRWHVRMHMICSISGTILGHPLLSTAGYSDWYSGNPIGPFRVSKYGVRKMVKVFILGVPRGIPLFPMGVLHRQLPGEMSADFQLMPKI